MAGFPPAAHIKDALAAMAKYTPEDMFTFVEHMKYLPEMAGDFAAMLRMLARKVESELPSRSTESGGNPVVDLIDAMAQASRASADAASEVHPACRRQMAPYLARREAPRPGEQLWNV